MKPLFVRPIVIVTLLYVLAILLWNGLKPVPEEVEMKKLPSECIVEGIVVSDPEVRRMADDERLTSFFLFELDSADGADVEPFTCRVRWYGYAGARAPDYGERWKMKVRRLPFDSSKSGYCFLLAVRRDSDLISPGNGSWLKSRCYRARRSAGDLLERGIEGRGDVVAVLHALLLGYRGELVGELKELFTVTGTLHVFAISGLHVGIIAMLLIFVLKRCGISRIYWVLFLAPALLFYTVATGARASAVRACIMMLIFFFAPLLKRKADIYSTLAFAALLILLFDPGQLFAVGFVYSFVVVSGIIFICPLIERPFLPLLQPDPMRIEEEQWRVILKKCGRLFVSLAAASVAAWLVSMPLTLYFFGRFAPIALLSNLFVVPLVFLIVGTGCLTLIAGSCATPLAVLLNSLNALFVSLLLSIMELLSKLPFGSVESPKPPLWVVCGWYGLLIAAVAVLQSRKGKIQGRVEEWDLNSSVT